MLAGLILDLWNKLLATLKWALRMEFLLLTTSQAGKLHRFTGLLLRRKHKTLRIFDFIVA